MGLTVPGPGRAGRILSLPGLALVAMLLAAAPALSCGKDSDCVVGDRTYRLYRPEGRPPSGLLVFAHGYRGSAAAEMRNAALLAMADDLGLAVAALQSEGDGWALAHSPDAPGRDAAQEFDYVDAVLDDATARTGVDPGRIVMAGFSAGAMLVWTIACERPDRFRGFVPMSGTFWAPVPETCPGRPANLVHVHGTADGTVPLAGRAVGGARQGDVGAAMAMYARTGGFRETGLAEAPEGTTCRQSANPEGTILDLCTFDGGHVFSVARLRYAIERVLAAPPPP